MRFTVEKQTDAAGRPKLRYTSDPAGAEIISSTNGIAVLASLDLADMEDVHQLCIAIRTAAGDVIRIRRGEDP